MVVGMTVEITISIIITVAGMYYSWTVYVNLTFPNPLPVGTAHIFSWWIVGASDGCHFCAETVKKRHARFLILFPPLP